MSGDFGTPELQIRGNAVLEQGDPNDITTRRIRVESSMIDWYAKRHYLTPQQVQAAEQYAQDAYLAGLDPKVTGSFEASVQGSTSQLSDARIAAQVRRHNAMRFLEAIPPRDHLRQLMDAVCIQGIAAGRYAMSVWGSSPDEAMKLLEYATNALGKHYGLLR